MKSGRKTKRLLPQYYWFTQTEYAPDEEGDCTQVACRLPRHDPKYRESGIRSAVLVKIAGPSDPYHIWNDRRGKKTVGPDICKE